MPLPPPVIIGNATLYCGDCLEILPELKGVDAVGACRRYHKFPAKMKWFFRLEQFSEWRT